MTEQDIIRDKLEEIRPQVEMLGALYDEAETEGQREAIKKQGIDLVAQVFVKHMMSKAAGQMLSMLGSAHE